MSVSAAVKSGTRLTLPGGPSAYSQIRIARVRAVLLMDGQPRDEAQGARGLVGEMTAAPSETLHGA